MNGVTELERYHERLDHQREQRLAAWEKIEHELPVDGSGTPERDPWIKAREEFYQAEGPIPVSRSDREALADLKDRYRGERIFVLGNGPSLNDTPLHLLDQEFTFCVNRIYLLFERIRWRPTFYTTVDWRVTADCADEINALTGMQMFLPERFRGLLREGDDVTWYWNGPSPDPSQRRFATDASLGIRGAGSVTGAAIQLAFHMGFDPIYLLGCDVSYTIPESVIQEGPDRFGNGVGLYLTSTRNDDANHFDPRYFGSGRRWHDPNVKRMIEGFEQCREGADTAGRSIINATVGGQLEVFERVSVRSLFNRRRIPPPRAVDQGDHSRISVPEGESVAPALLIKTLLDDEPGIVVSFGTKSADGISTFAAAGWEVRAFEPHPDTHDDLVATIPTRWPVFIDPRAIGRLETSASMFTAASGHGSLLPGSTKSEEPPTVAVVTPQLALAPLNVRRPKVLLLSAAGWQKEILDAYPWEEARPDAVLVSVDDNFTPRLGYRGVDLARALEDLDYSVFGIEHRRTGPRGGIQAVCRPSESVGDLTHIVALPRGVGSIDELQASRRAIIAARLEASASRALRPTAGDFDDEDLIHPVSNEVATLRREIDEIHRSISWRLGHGIVLSGKSIVTAIPRLIASLKRRISSDHGEQT